MSILIIKLADEIAAGDFKAALSTLQSGSPAPVVAFEDDLGKAVEAFAEAFGSAEATTILTSLSTALKSGVKAGLSTAQTGTVANAQTAATTAANAL